MSLRILLVDDHRLFRDGLRALIRQRHPEATLAEAGTGAAALEAAPDFKPDLVLLDLHLPDSNGLDVARQITALVPGAKVLMISAEPDLSYVGKALALGISGYLLKTCSPEELMVAINAILAGRIYLCSEANTVVLQDYVQVLTAPPAEAPVLSRRELEVLGHVANGLRTKEIAARLDVAIKTVETFRRRLMTKLHCQSTADLVRYAIRQGIIQP